MEIKEQKKQLRNHMFGLRITQDSEEKSIHDSRICRLLSQLVEEHHHVVIHCYIPFAGEIDIRPFIQELMNKGKTVVCPKTLPKRQLENRIFRSFDELEVGIKGTMHPVDKEVYEGEYDLIIVPGLAFDSNGYRLGYGGGYYDTFLNGQSALTVGIFYPFQEIGQVPREAHDIKLDRVIC